MDGFNNFNGMVNRPEMNFNSMRNPGYDKDVSMPGMPMPGMPQMNRQDFMNAPRGGVAEMFGGMFGGLGFPQRPQGGMGMPQGGMGMPQGGMGMPQGGMGMPQGGMGIMQDTRMPQGGMGMPQGGMGMPQGGMGIMQDTRMPQGGMGMPQGGMGMPQGGMGMPQGGMGMPQGGMGMPQGGMMNFNPRQEIDKNMAEQSMVGMPQFNRQDLPRTRGDLSQWVSQLQAGTPNPKMGMPNMFSNQMNRVAY
jgi:hypothetical protein